MAVFFVHDVGRGIVTPLDRKFRVRDIPPTDELTEISATHAKTESDPKNYPDVNEQKNHSQGSNQQAIESYQNTQSNNVMNLGKVKDIMSSPILTMKQDQNLAEAWHLMQKYEIHHLVIVNDDNAYSGMLSEKKIVPFLMANTKEPLEKNSPQNTPLRIFCHETLLSTHPETKISDLAPALLEYGLDSIAVSDNGAITGIVTFPDILKVILKSKAFDAEA